MSQKSADAIRYVLQHKKKKKVEFCRATGISRASLYKYLKGLPIHPKKAKMIVEGVKKKWHVIIPLENLID